MRRALERAHVSEGPLPPCSVRHRRVPRRSVPPVLSTRGRRATKVGGDVARTFVHSSRTPKGNERRTERECGCRHGPSGRPAHSGWHAPGSRQANRRRPDAGAPLCARPPFHLQPNSPADAGIETLMTTSTRGSAGEEPLEVGPGGGLPRTRVTFAIRNTQQYLSALDIFQC